MTAENSDICGKLYEYLACNDTIHDFGKGEDTRKIIQSIHKSCSTTTEARNQQFRRKWKDPRY